MTTSTHPVRTARAAWGRSAAFLVALGALVGARVARADESELVLPDLASVTFLGMSGRTLLMSGILVCLAGLAFGLVMYGKLKNLPVHKSMREVSELIYETCKTYLVTQGKFILVLELFIGTIMVFYFGWLRHMEAGKVAVILLASLVGIAGSYGVAWFGIRINTFANSRDLVREPARQALPLLCDPARGGHVDRDDAHLDRAHPDARDPPVHPSPPRGPVLHRLRDRRVPRRLSPAHRRRHLHEDRRHRLGPHEDRLQDQGRRRAQPRRHRRLHGRQRGRLRRPDGRRLRDLRRHRRRAHLVHPPRGSRTRRRRSSSSSGSSRCAS